jgi:hypothetical protein
MNRPFFFLGNRGSGDVWWSLSTGQKGVPVVFVWSALSTHINGRLLIWCIFLFFWRSSLVEEWQSSTNQRRLSAFLFFWSSHISHVIIRIQISRNELRRWVLRPKGLLACLFVFSQSRDGKRWSWWCMPNIITIWFKWSSSARGPGMIIGDHSSILWACV